MRPNARRPAALTRPPAADARRPLGAAPPPLGRALTATEVIREYVLGCSRAAERPRHAIAGGLGCCAAYGGFTLLQGLMKAQGDLRGERAADGAWQHRPVKTAGSGADAGWACMPLYWPVTAALHAMETTSRQGMTCAARSQCQHHCCPSCYLNLCCHRATQQPSLLWPNKSSPRVHPSTMIVIHYTTLVTGQPYYRRIAGAAAPSNVGRAVCVK